MKNTSEAQDNLRLALKINPEHEEAQQMLNDLEK